MPIPRSLHQAWIPPLPGAQLPEKTASNIELWRKTYPNFQHRMWSLDEILALVAGSNFHFATAAEATAAIRACRFPSMQADIGRMVILYFFGGFWIDLKIVPRTDFINNLLNHPLVVVDHPPAPGFENPTEAKLLSNGFIGAIPGSPVIRECIRLALTNIIERRPGTVWELTGPRILMNALLNLHGDIFTNPPSTLARLPYTAFWESAVGWGWCDYQTTAMHWSERQKHEQMYQ